MSPKTHLNISYQDICDLDQQQICRRDNERSITCLYASRNKLASIDQLTRYHSLRELYLRDNSIMNLTQLRPLRSCKDLRILSLRGNPIAQRERYLEEVASFLPQLEQLDDCDDLQPHRRRYASRLAEGTPQKKTPATTPVPERPPTPPAVPSSDRASLDDAAKLRKEAWQQRERDSIQRHRERLEKNGSPGLRRPASPSASPYSSPSRRSAESSPVSGKERPPSPWKARDAKPEAHKSVGGAQGAILEAIASLVKGLDNEGIRAVQQLVG